MSDPLEWLARAALTWGSLCVEPNTERSTEPAIHLPLATVRRERAFHTPSAICRGGESMRRDIRRTVVARRWSCEDHAGLTGSISTVILITRKQLLHLAN